MGQIESTLQNETSNLSKETEEKENQGGNASQKRTESQNENKEMLHCVKNQIDMLIEGCLLSKESNDMWVPDKRLKKPAANEVIELDASENPKDADNGADLDSDCSKLRESHTEDADVSKNITETGVSKVNENEKCTETCDAYVKDEKSNETNTPETDQYKGDPELKQEIEIKIEDKKSIKVEAVIETQTVSERREKLKMADIISEMTKNNMAGESNKKKLTTFQTFIDQVLDNSLQHVNSTTKVEKTTNILELCSKSMAQNEKQESCTKKEVTKTETISENRSTLSTHVNLSRNTNTNMKTEKEKPVKSEVNMISLKDHIERFLEQSFKESKSENDDHHSVQNRQEEKKITKPGGSENFNAQGLVNNMINQGLEINKLLSPNSSKGKDAQKSVNVRSEAENMGRRDFSQVPYDNRQYVQNPKYSEAERMNMNRQYPVGSKYSSGPQRSPNGSNPNYHELEQQRGYLVRPKVEYPDYKARIYSGSERRDEHMLLQERYAGYPTHKLQKPVPHLATTHAPENTLHPAMMYPAQFSPRHPLLTTADMQKEHAIGLLQESMSNRGQKQAVHLRDCKCAMCIPLPDPRYQGRDHKSPEYLQPKLQLSPSAFPQIAPSHPIHPAYLSFQKLQTPQDPTPAMMRPSHSAVPPGLGYPMPVPKLLPQHPPITSPKEYSQLQMAVQQNIPTNKSTHLSHRMSTEENISAEMYAAYRQNRLDPASAYQRRPKEHEMAQGKYGGYPAPSPRRPSPSPRHPSPATRDDRPKEVHDILLSPDSRVLGNDWGRRRDCPSNSSASSASGEAPLDLSFKKSEPEKSRRPSFSNFSVSPDVYQADLHRTRTQSFVEESRRAVDSPRGGDSQRPRSQTMGGQQQQGGNLQRKENTLFNTFIKHLENSVDKYSHELKQSPPPGHLITTSNPPSNKSGSPSDISAVGHGYQGQMSPSAGSQIPKTLSPCAPYAGGITLGQPIIGPEGRVHMDNRQSPKQAGMPLSSSSLTQPQLQSMQQQAASATPSASFISQRNNVSKHEPIQNIIGNHDPNDILYLICRLCSQTYGSPYGFRKHFRNQHGFEPRAEDTIVQTISATKKNLGGPNAQNLDGMEKNNENIGPQVNTANLTQEFSEMESNSSIINESPSLLKSNSNSSQDLNSLNSEEESSDKTKPVQDDTKETKCLECPECGKTFQLNDFGSYKRHCRQHNTQVKMTGTLTCSKCHLSFADQHLLKEHYNIHVKDLQTQNKNEKPVSKSETPSIVQSCVPCDKSFDDVSAYQDHVKTNHNKNDGPPKLSPQVNIVNENTNESVTLRDDAVETKWPDISLSVIPSHNVVKQAAESMTATACPDSSSSWCETDNDKNVTASSEEKVNDGLNESLDSVNMGSNSNVSVDSNVNEKDENSKTMDYSSEKSIASSQDDEKDLVDGCEFQYVHKKFSSHRKRAVSSCSQSSDTGVSASKQSKLSPPVLSRSDTPVTSCSVLVTNQSADSTDSLDYKGEESLDGKDCPAPPSSTNDLKLSPLDEKQEARHHLPFVWDRVTRSQVGRKTK